MKLTTASILRTRWLVIGIGCALLLITAGHEPLTGQPTASADLEITAVWGVEGWANFEFGLIVDMALTPDGNVYVLDELAPGLALLDPNGRELAALFGRGNGPQEFRSPQSIAVSSTGEPVVLDVGRGTLRWFRRHGDTFESYRTWRPPFNANDFCFLEDRLVLVARSLDPNARSIFHVFSTAGSLVHSFSIPAREAGVPLGGISAGRLECVAGKDLILFLPRHYGKIFSFSSTGEFLWAVSLPGYLQLGMEAGRGWIQFQSADPDVGSDAGASLVPYGDMLVVQFGRVTRDLKRIEVASELTTILLDAATGNLIGQTKEVPRLTAAGAGEFFWGFLNYPSPTVIKYRR